MLRRSTLFYRSRVCRRLDNFFLRFARMAARIRTCARRSPNVHHIVPVNCCAKFGPDLVSRLTAYTGLDWTGQDRAHNRTEAELDTYNIDIDTNVVSILTKNLYNITCYVNIGLYTIILQNTASRV
jgi:hypothetical protein